MMLAMRRGHGVPIDPLIALIGRVLDGVRINGSSCYGIVDCRAWHVLEEMALNEAEQAAVQATIPTARSVLLLYII